MALSKKNILLFVVATLSLIGGITYVTRAQKQALTVATTAKKAVYSCPMHPSVVSDHPDKCPICHMDLQKVGEEETSGSATTSGKGKLLFYRHPMRSDVTSPVPAKDEMGMDYIPIYEEDTKGSGQTSNVDGRASFSLSQEKQQLIGVTTAKAVNQPLSFEVRASGKVAFDPELFTVIEEYRQAVLSRSQMGDSPYESIKKQSDELIASAKTKLRLMGLTDSQIRRLGNSHNSPMNLILPKGNVWIYAEVFEYEVAGLKAGLSVEVVAPSVPGKVFSGKVTSISPILNSQTRTVRVRAQVPDPEQVLRPDTFVNVRIKVDLGLKLVVPADSVLHSGDRDFVFLVQEKGKFEPRLVQVGVKANDQYEIVSGITEGDTVATSANFLIDSESRLRATVQNMKPSTSVPPPSKGGDNKKEATDDRKNH